MKNICVVTATRAEYGLLKPLMSLIKDSSEFNLQIIATGAHLSPEFGLTYQSLEKDGFKITEKVEILMSSDTAVGLVKTMGMCMISFADVFDRLKPDLLIVLGDRYEILSVVSAATIFKIPIAHLHGGEITEGAYDDAIRHAITKMSHLHFVSTKEYRNRVIQMGEQGDSVFHVGAIGLDNIRNLKLLEKDELEKDLGINFKKHNYQVTFHPETLGNMSSKDQFSILLEALDTLEDSLLIFTKANADTDGRIINQMIDEYVFKHPDKAVAFHSLGALRFLSLVKISDAIIGNSSSGILEAPSLKTPTINIGDRQRGRTQAESIINCKCTKQDILHAVERSKESNFIEFIQSVINPYDNGGAAEKIFSELKHLIELNSVKKFNDLSWK